MILSWFRRSRMAKSLVGVNAPTLVAIDVRVRSENSIVSPATGIACAVLSWSFCYGTTSYSRGGGFMTRWARYCGDVIGADLLLACSDGILIEVPFPSGAKLKLQEDRGDAQPLNQRIVSAFPHAFARSAPVDGQLGYRESYLLQGDRLVFRGMVAPVRPGVFRLAGHSSVDAELIEPKPF
jgi:hypothetical protein